MKNKKKDIMKNKKTSFFKNCAMGVTCIEVSTPEFRKSKGCVMGVTCVEIAKDSKNIFVRDSKNPEIVLEFTSEEWKSFIEGVKKGEFDL